MSLVKRSRKVKASQEAFLYCKAKNFILFMKEKYPFLNSPDHKQNLKNLLGIDSLKDLDDETDECLTNRYEKLVMLYHNWIYKNKSH